MDKLRTQELVEIAILAAIALLLDIVIPSPSWAFSVSVKMVPIIILALRRGVGAGLLGGFLWGVLQWVVGNAYFLTPIQFILEYFVAFAMIGFAGVLSSRMQASFRADEDNRGQQIGIAVGATIIGSFLRYVIHFIAGVWFWGHFAPEGQSPYLYSFLINGGAFLSETIACVIIMILLARFYRSLIQVRDLRY